MTASCSEASFHNCVTIPSVSLPGQARGCAVILQVVLAGEPGIYTGSPTMFHLAAGMPTLLQVLLLLHTVDCLPALNISREGLSLVLVDSILLV